MPNNELGNTRNAKDLNMPRGYGSHDPEFEMVRQIDGHATEADSYDRGDGKEIKSWANRHNPFEDYDNPVGTPAGEEIV